MAQTPVELVIEKYENVPGARSFIASGVRLSLARNLIRQSPVGVIADDVDELAVLKMENAPLYSRISFQHDLDAVLKDYEFHGTHSSKNGLVDVYILRSASDSIRELVIYNPSVFSLNSLRGDFPEKDLLALE